MHPKVLLIQPNYNIKKDAKIWTANPPLGPCYIAAVLEKSRIGVEILDTNTKNLSVRETLRIIKEKNPAYVGFSILTPAADWCVAVARRLPKTMISVAGGPHTSGLPETMVRKGFDIAVIGEGEQTMLEIAKGYAWEKINGIVFKKNGKLIRTPARIPLDPNTIPFPARHLIEKGGTDKPYLSAGTVYYPWAQLFSSRGCPYNCYFCNKNIFGYRYRPRTPQDIIREIDFLVKTYGVKEIDIYDDNFNFDMKRAEKILDLIIRKKYTLCLRFSNGIRADKVSVRLLRKMKKAGTQYIAYGVETGDETVLAKIPKGETLNEIRRAVALTNKAGIPVTGFFIFGLIGDTRETMQHTIDFAVTTGFDRTIINIATPYPGTRMWNMITGGGGKIFIKRWKDFHQTSGRMLYTMPGTADPTTVESMYRKAYRAFYFRPAYIARQIPNMLRPGILPVMLRGVGRILFSQNN